MLTPTVLRAAITDADPELASLIGPIKISTRRKTLGWSLVPGETAVTLQVPAHAPLLAIVKTARDHRHGIARMLLQGKQRAPEGPPTKQLVDGTSFLWLGETVRLRILDQASTPLRVVSGVGRGRFLELARPAVSQGVKPFIDWYSREGTRWMRQEAARLWPLLTSTTPMPEVVVGNIGETRWGVYYESKHLVRVSWRALQFPPGYARLVLLHELVHASRPDGKPHGLQFWRRYEAVQPGARRAQRQLQQLGHTLWRGDITP
ncbi:YgjP-like metallopeptidase domain-containing protein [Streptomyces sp. MN6]